MRLEGKMVLKSSINVYNEVILLLDLLSLIFIQTVKNLAGLPTINRK